MEKFENLEEKNTNPKWKIQQSGLREEYRSVEDRSTETNQSDCWRKMTIDSRTCRTTQKYTLTRASEDRKDRKSILRWPNFSHIEAYICKRKRNERKKTQQKQENYKEDHNWLHHRKQEKLMLPSIGTITWIITEDLLGRRKTGDGQYIFSVLNEKWVNTEL